MRWRSLGQACDHLEAYEHFNKLTVKEKTGNALAPPCDYMFLEEDPVVKENLTLEQATKTQSESRCIVLPFL